MDLLEKKKPNKTEESQRKLHFGVPTLNARDIMETEFPNLPWVVPGIIPAGLTILASRPKLGKSWLSLGIGLAVATGGTVLGQIEVPKREVLYIALEDTERRLQNRLKMLLPDAQAPEGLHFALHWPKLDTTGAKALNNWVKANPETGLIIIDTLARIRGSRRGAMYDNDYKEIAEVKSIADGHGIGVIVVHHLRKAEAKDIMDMVSGSTGLTGAADTVAVLTRDRSRADATLFLGGREVEDQELALRFDSGQGWVIMGPSEEYNLTVERQQIVDLLRQEGCTMRLGDIARALGKKKPNVINLLNSLMEQGLVEKTGYGKYQLKAGDAESSESNEPAEPSAEPPAEEAAQADGPGEGTGAGELSEPDELAA
jgi:hypothetical protein